MADKRMAPPELGTLSGVEAQSFHVALNTVIWGYPSVLFEELMAGRTNPEAELRTGSPRSLVNQFGRVRQLRGPEYKQIATPNNDTLFIQSFVDVSREPLVLSVPKIDPGRYYVLQLWDPNGDTFGHIGTRVTGNGEGTYALVGPDWKGTLPAAILPVNCPTNSLAIWGRVAVYGPQDIERAQAIQDEISLVPLSRFLAGVTTEVPDLRFSEKRVHHDIAAELEPELAFFAKLARALNFTPAKAIQDDVVVDQMSLIGFSHAGRSFDPKGLGDAHKRGMIKAYQFAHHLMDVQMQSVGEMLNGWQWSRRAGMIGTDYLFRACWAKWFTGGNLPDEAIYMMRRLDAQGQKLTGNKRHVLQFAADAMPPVTAFWSLSMYDAADGSFTHNEINRYSIGDRTPDLKQDADGGLTIVISHERPGDAGNWLPAPQGEFYLMMRLYLPTDALSSGLWAPPELD